MNYSLVNHSKGLNISLGDAALTLLTGFSGISYAVRHFQMANTSGYLGALGHHLVCLIELVPILGGIVAAIEGVASAIFRLALGAPPTIPWRKEAISIKDAESKMLKNTAKAVSEHKGSGYAYAFSAVPSMKSLQKPENTPLTFKHSFAEDIGPRKQMEDAHIYKEMKNGLLAAVFDGHGGKSVSKYASKRFEKRFAQVLKETGGNVHRAFEILLHQIDKEVSESRFWNHQGSTAVISYIDKNTHKIYTATLGDSEANIYRKTGLWGRSSIPLSCVRDWASTKDAARLESTYQVPGLVDYLLEQGMPPKFIRSKINPRVDIEKLKKALNEKTLKLEVVLTQRGPSYGVNSSPNEVLFGGVNVARNLGDIRETAATHKPKITVNKVKKGDVLVVACDGLKDFVPEKEIVKIVSQHKGEAAQVLVDHAVKTRKAKDNVTALTIEVM